VLNATGLTLPTYQAWSGHVSSMTVSGFRAGQRRGAGTEQGRLYQGQRRFLLQQGRQEGHGHGRRPGGLHRLRAAYLDVHRVILREHWTPHYIPTPGWPERVAKSATVDPSAQLRGCSVVGENCRVGAGALLEDTILWPDAQIASKSQLHGCIVRSQKKVSGIHRNSDI